MNYTSLGVIISMYLRFASSLWHIYPHKNSLILDLYDRVWYKYMSFDLNKYVQCYILECNRAVHLPMAFL